MTQEEKELLLKDLCARLSYGVKIELTWWIMGEGTCINTTLEPDHIEQLLNDEYGDTEIKPYLRPMSSMTEDKEIVYEQLIKDVHYKPRPSTCCKLISWLKENYFDYNYLIEKGLAIEVTEENNPYEN